MFRLSRLDVAPVGIGQHRHGWPVVFAALQQMQSPDEEMLLDDFAERSFSYTKIGAAYNHPWVGIFHHPPQPPEYATNLDQQWEAIFKTKLWKDSAKKLVHAIFTSEYARKGVAAYDNFPQNVGTSVALHPGFTEVEPWTWEKFKAGNNFGMTRYKRLLLQCGWYLRNTRAIFQIPEIEGYHRMRLMDTRSWILRFDKACRDHFRAKEYEGTEEVRRVSNGKYDRLFASSLLLTQVLDASANNVVLDCLFRATPLLVNRHPAVVEYLGAGYPLYFDDIEEVHSLISDEKILAAHEYLKLRDKQHLTVPAFARRITEIFEGLQED